jgi:hypothetical protein
MYDKWQLEEYEEKGYLHNKVLLLKEYVERCPNHEHCELCWARFSDYEDDLHSGYYERETQSWICPECYYTLKDLFGWSFIVATDK